jgi:uncharacterized protein
MTHAALVNVIGLIIGLVFGVAGQRSGFCLTSALRNWRHDRDKRKLRSFALALAVAIAGTQLLIAGDVVDLRRSIYLQADFSWLLLLGGGALFGYGMVLANSCGARALVLLGTGNLRSFVVLVCIGISGYAALSGVAAPWGAWIGRVSSVSLATDLPTMSALLAPVDGSRAEVERLTTAVLVALLAGFALSDARLRAAPRELLGAVVIGSLIPAAWFVTGFLGADDFEPVPVVALSFIGPIGETIQYLMLASGTPLGFGVTVVAGVVAGSALAAGLAGEFRLETFSSPQHMLRLMAGGVLMGLGGAFARGCSIGQGLSGLSTLAVSSLIAATGILLGALVALKAPANDRGAAPQAKKIM